MSAGNISSFINAKIFHNSSSAANSSSKRSAQSKLNIKSRKNNSISKFTTLKKNSALVSNSRSRVTTRTNEVLRSTRTKNGDSQRYSGTGLNKSKACNTGYQNRTDEKVLLTIFETPNNLNARIGSCLINYNTGEMILSDYMDSQIFLRTVHKIQLYEPTDILLPSNSLSPKVSKLATIIKFNISNDVKISEAPVKFFNSQEGLQVLSKSSINEYEYLNKKDELVQNNYALSAVSASVKYSENDYTLNKYRVKYETTDNTMLIDSRTIVGLELVENKFDKNGLSLFKFLDNTCTKMGQRTLRNNILQPLTDKENIYLRLKMVQELENNNDFLMEIRVQLKKLQDLDKLFSRLLSINKIAINPDQKINYILSLKNSLLIILDLKEILIKLNPQTKILTEIKEILKNPAISDLLLLFNSHINEDSTWADSVLELQNQRTYAVRSGANGLLDISRQIHKNTTDEIMSEIDNIIDANDFYIDYSYDSSRGFFIKIKKQNDITPSNFPNNFINMVEKKRGFECTTVKLMKLNLRLREVLSEITIISENVIDDLLGQIDAYISVLFMVSEAVALLDLLSTFSFNCYEKDYCYPTFSNKLFLVESRHPILETSIKDFIPNNISSTPSICNFQVITGCNKSGKSVYLKQIALLCIMSQIGTPIPAKIASVPLYTKLHARVCNDTLEMTSSTFTFEMKEMAYFLDNLTEKTLLIMDELGRGSSIGDGFAISLAMAEYILEKSSTAFLSTHFTEMAHILNQRVNVSHLSMKTELDDDSELKMLFKASEQINEITNFGFHFAKQYYPEELLSQAKKIQESLITNKNQKLKEHISTNNRKQFQDKVKRMKQLNTIISIMQELVDNQNELNVDTLKQFQDQFVNSFD